MKLLSVKLDSDGERRGRVFLDKEFWSLTTGAELELLLEVLDALFRPRLRPAMVASSVSR